MEKIERPYLNLILTVSILVTLYLTSQNWKNQLVLHDVKVYDASMLTTNEVKTLADVQDGSALYGLSLAKISNSVERNPFVKQAIVVRALPYDLSITVHERNPIALLAIDSPQEQMLSVDNEGIVLPLPLGRRNNLPIIANIMERLQVGDTVTGTLMQAVKFICDADKIGPTLSANIAEVKLDEDDLIAYTTTSSLPVIIGNSSFERKLIYLQSFLEESAKNGDPSYNYIDLRFNGQIAVGMLETNSISSNDSKNEK